MTFIPIQDKFLPKKSDNLSPEEIEKITARDYEDRLKRWAVGQKDAMRLLERFPSPADLKTLFIILAGFWYFHFADDDGEIMEALEVVMKDKAKNE